LSLRFSQAELVELTDYQQPARQLEELHRRGFWRAVRSRVTGQVVLERAHYDAVCAGADRQTPTPTLRPIPKLRSV